MSKRTESLRELVESDPAKYLDHMLALLDDEVIEAFNMWHRMVRAYTYHAAADLVDEWHRAYPPDIFIEPPVGEHGQTVDACSARMARYVTKRIAKELRAKATR